jgi:alginate O-acetyltransferase complex protein AlgJ
MERLTNLSYTILFCGILAVVPVFYFLGIGVQSPAAFEEFDQRPRSQPAALAWDRDQLKIFFASLEKVVSDRLPLREQLLGLKTRIALFFGKGLNPEVVVVGKNGWLFFGNAVGRGIDQYRGILRMDEDQLNAFRDYFQGIRVELEKRGIPFLLVVAPEKHSIYPENLPLYFFQKGDSPGDQILPLSSGFDLLDLRPVLLGAKAQSPLPLYPKTDSHWNELGAYLAYRKIMDRLPEFPALELEDGVFAAPGGPGKGDLAVKVGGGASFPDNLVHVHRDFFRGKFDVEDFKENTSSTMSANAINRVSQNPSLVVSNPAKEGTILLIGDSFLENIAPFFNNTFGTSVYQHYTKFGPWSVEALVEHFRPRAVVFTMAERNLVLPIGLFLPARQAAPAPETQPRDLKAPSHSIPPEKLLAESELVRGIENMRTEGSDVVFTATDFDPYFHLPHRPAMPGGAKVVLELTLPAERMVQLFYQTTADTVIAEENSVKTSLPAGRHVIEWTIDALLNGIFRLDPGNAPGEYRLHKIEILPR